jgi:pSer/pThr/pTyr-binding forkhead associated (FHA) protein
MSMQLEEPIEMLEPEPEPETDPIRLPHDQSGIDMEDDEVAAAVARTLLVPAHHVKAVEDNSDRIHEKHGAAGVQAYAKLSGNGWTFYVKKLVNVIGRPPEQPCDTIEPPQDLEHGALPAAAESDRGVHVNLGPSKMVSRNHAEILFDSNTEKWNIQVQGRNGIRINGATLRRGEVKPLSSGEVIEIGGVEMMFVMPNENEPLVVHRTFLQRAGLISIDPEKTDEEDVDGLSPGPSGSSAIRGQKGTPGGLPIAPAPPDYRRPGTPVSARSKINYTTGKSPYVGGTIVMNAEDVDLSIDQNRHIKPTFSYAQLITQAILDGQGEKQTLANIYKYITDRFAYYRFQPAGGWQVSDNKVWRPYHG